MLTRRGLLAALPSLPLARIIGSGDQRAFRAWYTWLAEAAFFWPGPTLPREIRDCSSLARFAFRNALLPHTAEWAHSLGRTEFPPLPALSRRGFAPLRTLAGWTTLALWLLAGLWLPYQLLWLVFPLDSIAAEATLAAIRIALADTLSIGALLWLAAVFTPPSKP